MAIIYIPEERKDARNFPRRVYFSCHEEDSALLDAVLQQLHQIIDDCVVAFHKPGTEVDSDHFEEVEDFPLVVIPVTPIWFQNGLQQQEFARLKEHNKPMIPILFDDSLVEQFNAHTDEMQFLRIGDPEYSEKLKRALQSLLVDSETVKEVHKVFTHKLFIAYCREDLEKVRQLIRCIHQSEEGRKISVWFDKYLQAGRNFEEVIFSQLDGSQMFGMVLTPHLVKRDTYVKRQEYPRALAGKKRMIVFQLEDADWQTLYDELETIAYEQGLPSPKQQQPVRVSRDESFATYIKRMLREIGGGSDVKERREQNYLLGLAYRNGIGVEFDYRYAMKKFKAAADEGEYRSAHCLAEMFLNGIGVRRDLKQAKKWYIREIEYLFEEYKKCIALIKTTPIPIFKFEDGTTLDSREEVADSLKNEILRMAGKLVGQACLNARILRDNGYWDDAESLYRLAQKALVWSENNVNQVGVTAKYGNDLENELNHFLIFRGKRDLQACKKSWEQALAAWQADDLERCFTAVKSGHNYATVLMTKEQGRTALQVMERTLELIEEAPGTLPQSVAEIQLQLYRDSGRCILLHSPDNTEQRKENAARARLMLQKELQLLAEYPFDVVENPYLLCKAPWNSFYKAEAYLYEEDYANAFLCYVDALEKTKKTQTQLGELSIQRDLPLLFLQLYAEIARQLNRFQHIPESLIQRFREILEEFEVLDYNAEHQLEAKKYLAEIRAVLEKGKTGE